MNDAVTRPNNRAAEVRVVEECRGLRRSSRALGGLKGADMIAGAALIASLLGATQAVPGSPAPEPMKAPADYVERFVAGETVVWFGEVVDAVASVADDGEVTIQWLCRYREFTEPFDAEMFFAAAKSRLASGQSPQAPPTIRVRADTPEQYFVTMLRSRDMPVSQAEGLVADAKRKPHFALRRAKTVSVDTFVGKVAVLIGGGDSVISDKLVVEGLK